MEEPVQEANARPPARRRLNILSLDGGGIRGLSILFILQDLMQGIQKEQKLETTPLPCELFDLIVGTSTGGLIALMIGRLRMPVDEAIDAYHDLSKRVFRKAVRWRLNPLSSAPRFSGEVLENAVQNIAKNELLADPDPKACKVAVVAVNELAADGPPELLRTYESQTVCKVSDAARATTAATTFFPPAIVQVKHGRKVTYLDGGLGNNNPTKLGIQEAQKIWRSDYEFQSIISIGTGTSSNVKFTGNKLKLATKLRDIQTSCQSVHVAMNDLYGGRHGVYFRFDVPTDLNKIGLDEWARLDDVAGLTHHYIESESVKFRECVEAIAHRVTHSDAAPLETGRGSHSKDHL